MAGMDKHSGCPVRIGSGFVLFFRQVVVIIAPFGDDPLDNEPGTAEIIPGKFPDANNLRC
jgi:hypothetical protein